MEPPPFADCNGGGICWVGAAATDRSADGSTEAAKIQARRILRHCAGFDRGERAPACRLRHPRPLARALRCAGVPQRAGADLGVPRLRRIVGPAARCQGRALHRHLRQGRLVHRPHRLSRQGNDGARRRRSLADALVRRQADHRARLVRHRSRSRSTARSSMSGSSASTGSCASISPRALPARSARRCRCRPRRAGCPTTGGSRRWSSCPRASRSPAR